MGYVDILIPGLIGLSLILFPRAFTKAQGDAFEAAKLKFKKMGGILLIIAVLYSTMKYFER